MPSVQFWALRWWLTSKGDKAGSQAVWKDLLGSHHHVFNQDILLETACDFMLEDSDMLKQWKLQNLELAFLNI